MKDLKIIQRVENIAVCVPADTTINVAWVQASAFIIDLDTGAYESNLTIFCVQTYFNRADITYNDIMKHCRMGIVGASTSDSPYTLDVDNVVSNPYNR